MNRVTDESNFCSFYDSAKSIYDYIDMSQELSVSPWGFDVATFSDDRTTTYAQFSCTSVSGCGTDRLTVRATKNDEGFNLSHKVERG